MYMHSSQHGANSSDRVGQAPKYEADMTEAMGLFQYMEQNMLQEMLDNPEKINAHIADLRQVKKIQQDRETITIKNKSLAEFNMSFQPKLDTLKREVATGYETVNNLKMTLGTSVASLDAMSTGQSQDEMLAIMQTEAAEEDEQSEQVAEDLCDNKIPVDEFISNYLPMRTKAYISKAKAEKLAELIRQGSSTGNSPYTDPRNQGGMSQAPYSQPFGGTSAGFGMPTPYNYNR